MSIGAGNFVRLTSDPGRSGVVQSGEKIQAGERMVPVQFGDGRVSWLLVANLEPVVAAPPDLADRFAEGRFVAPEWLRRTLTRIRVTGRLSDIVYSMEATDTNFYAFQFKPVLKLLNSPTDALLIADEVGLGKTIEAGLIWTELRARLESNRLLVICPKTLCEKWYAELDRRFGVDARIVDAADLLRLLSTSRSGGRGFAAIASMQALRPPQGWDADDGSDRVRRGDTRRRLSLLLSDAAESEPLIDLLVIDEAHHMRNPATHLYRLGELVNAVSAHRVFLSATPIHLRNRDLHSLLRLIDPDTFQYERTLDDLIRTNEPIIAARDLLMRAGSREKIIERIDAALQYEILADSKALRLIREDMERRQLDTATRAELASRLESVNQLANSMTRTRRRDVEELRISRRPLAPLLEMHEDERTFYDAITHEVANYASECGANARFLASTPQRLLTSSPAAAAEYWSGYVDGRKAEIEETDTDLESNNLDDRPLVGKLAKLARELGMTERLAAVDTKFQLLLSQLRYLWRVEEDAKIIVFSSFKPTLHYLRRRLAVEGIKCELMHGSIREPRINILERFRNEVEVRVLLSSEVGSEGVDLQFCWIVVNYDLPWNPMRLEQRVGRVDRLGQEKNMVTVVNLIYKQTIDDTIYHRLYERLELTKRALGEFEAILGEPIRNMTSKLLNPGLTAEQKRDIVDQTAQAAENRRRDEARLEEEAGALIEHGDYILRKISESRELHRWLSGSDILIYVKDRLDRSFPGCSIEASPPGSDTFRIALTPAARDDFGRFIGGRRLKGTTRLLDSDDRQRYRFTSSVASRRDGRAENISQLHALVRFAVELDERDVGTHEPHPVVASIERRHLKVDCDPGLYVIGIRQWAADGAGDRTNSVARIAYVAAALNGEQVLPPEVAEAMAGAAAEHGRSLPNFAQDERLPAAATTLRNIVLRELDRRYETFLERTKADIQDRIAIREQALKRHLESKTRTLEALCNSLRSQATVAASLGDEKHSRRLVSLVAANRAKIEKLSQIIGLRLKQLETQRQITPEWSEIAQLLIEVRS